MPKEAGPEHNKFTNRNPQTDKCKNQKEQIKKYELPSNDKYPIKIVSEIGVGNVEDAYPNYLQLKNKTRQTTTSAS